MRAIVILFAMAVTCLIGCLAGCSTTDQNDRTMQFLERGQAQGHLAIGSQGAFSVGATNEFFFGLKGTAVNFEGEVDFKNPMLRELAPPPASPKSTGEPDGQPPTPPDAP